MNMQDGEAQPVAPREHVGQADLELVREHGVLHVVAHARMGLGYEQRANDGPLVVDVRKNGVRRSQNRLGGQIGSGRQLDKLHFEAQISILKAFQLHRINEHGVIDARLELARHLFADGGGQQRQDLADHEFGAVFCEGRQISEVSAESEGSGRAGYLRRIYARQYCRNTARPRRGSDWFGGRVDRSAVS